MLSSIRQFRDNIKQARELGRLALAVSSMTTPAVDVSDLFRAQIVLAVSALDYFVHELIRLGMVEAAQGSRPKTNAYLKFQMPIAVFDSALAGSPCEIWVSDAVRERHSWLSFQQPDKIADAIRLISSIELWNLVAIELATSSADVKTGLKVIIDRRNTIAHEADMDPANPGFRWTINSTMANEATDFIDRIAEAIFKVAV
jgi:hypothetical protein